MSSLRNYLISIIVVSILSSVLSELLQTSAIRKTVKMVCGVILTITVLSPLLRYDLNIPSFHTSGIHQQTDSAIVDGQAMARDSLRKIIKEKTEAYILEKATDLGLTITVSVGVTNGNPPLPDRVSIRGKAPLYLKHKLEEILYTQLGIEKEKLEWTGQDS